MGVHKVTPVGTSFDIILTHNLDVNKSNDFFETYKTTKYDSYQLYVFNVRRSPEERTVKTK